MKRILEFDFHTVAETAEMLSVHPDTVLAWIKNDRIHAVRLGRRYFISKQEIFSYLKLKR